MLEAVSVSEPARPSFSALPRLLDHPERLERVLRSFSRDELHALASPARHGEPYGRTLLHRDAEGEVVLARWTGDEACAPHDHGRSHGAVWVVEGTFRETWFRVDHGSFRAFEQREHPPLSLFRVERDVIHAMAPVGPALTLHVYAPPVSAMRVFDRDRREALTVHDDSGAFIPRDVRMIAARTCFSALEARTRR